MVPDHGKLRHPGFVFLHSGIALRHPGQIGVTQVPPAREHLRAGKRLQEWKHEHGGAGAILAPASAPKWAQLDEGIG